MSNPSVTATISVDDKASPALRELASLADQISKKAKDALNGGNGNALANSFKNANAAAREHLGLLTSMRNLHREIAGFAAGIAGTKLYQGAREAITNYLPYERGVRYQNAIMNPSAADQKRLDAQRVAAASRYGVMPMDALSTQQAFATRNLSVPVVESGTDRSFILSKALNISGEQAAKLVEGITFSRGVHPSTGPEADEAFRRSGDLATFAAKRSGMTAEDIEQAAKYQLGIGTAAGISPETMFAINMEMKRQNVPGDEAGVFVRQFAARNLAPTREGRDALDHAGINYGDYFTQGDVSPEALDRAFTRKFGKGLTPEQQQHIQAAYDDHDRNVLGNPQEFAKAILAAVESDGVKRSKLEEKQITSEATNLRNLAISGFKGDALANAEIKSFTPSDWLAFLGPKQGARGAMLSGGVDTYQQYREGLQGSAGFADTIAKDRMEGAAAAVDRFSASLDAASKEIVKANDGVVTKFANFGTWLASMVAQLSPERIQQLTVAGALGTGAAITSATAGVLGLASAAKDAAVSLRLMSGRPGADISTSKPAGSGGGLSVLGALSKTFAIASVAEVVVPWMLEHRDINATEHAQAFAERHAAFDKGVEDYILHGKMPTFEDYAPKPGPFDKYQSNPWNVRRGQTDKFLRSIDGWNGDGTGWAESAKVNIGESKGFKDVDVKGTVNGEAELHLNIQGDIKPTPYLEGIIKRAETNANISLSGLLGTSMQGPGDNNTKPSQGALTGTK